MSFNNPGGKGPNDSIDSQGRPRFRVINGGTGNEENGAKVLPFPRSLTLVIGDSARGALVDTSDPFLPHADRISRGLYESALAYARAQLGDENKAVDLLAVILEDLAQEGINVSEDPDAYRNLCEAIDALLGDGDEE